MNMLRRSRPVRTYLVPRECGFERAQSCHYSTRGRPGSPPPYRPSTALDEWVEKEARPISLRQLTVFGRTLTEARLLSSANYVQNELPTRLAHRLRNIQTLPYSALTNPHISRVHELYYSAFERFRKVPEIRSLEDNDKLCRVIRETLNEHLSVIPSLAIGVLEIQSSVPPDVCDQLMTTMLRSRISRRVIAEQHLALTETFQSSGTSTSPRRTSSTSDDQDNYIGSVLLRCSATETIQSCARSISRLARAAHGPDVRVPQITLHGDTSVTFPYIPSHIEYMIGELLRNSVQAVIETTPADEEPRPIEVLVCDAAQHVIIRVSDRGGGVDRDILPYLWSFAAGPRRERRLKNLEQVPRLKATVEEMTPAHSVPPDDRPGSEQEDDGKGHGNDKGRKGYDSSLSSFTSRPPNLRLGIGLPISKIYAEYWAGQLEVHSLEGYGTDAFLQIGKLGNKNEVLSTRASMDAV